MSRIRDILKEKGTQVHTIEGPATVFEAISKMVENNCGALLVVEGEGAVAGIITERDYLRRIALEGRTSKTTAVQEIMSSPVVHVSPASSIDEAMALMTDKHIRHLAVVDDHHLAGIVSIGDLVKFQTRNLKSQVDYLTDYITAR